MKKLLLYAFAAVATLGVCTACKENPEEKITVTGVTVEPTTLTIAVGDEPVTLDFEILPANAENKNVTWSSSDPTKAAVSQDGEVTALAEGNTTITVTTEDGGKKAACEVTVKAEVTDPVLVESVTLGDADGNALPEEGLTLVEGDAPYQFAVNVLPEEATNKDVEWTSSNPQAATIDQTGLLTVVAAGETIVTATAKDGSEVFGECVVTVEVYVPDPVLVESIEIGDENCNAVTELTLVEGDEPYLFATRVLPENATNRELEWTSSNPEAATIDQAGLLTVVAAGETTVRATAKDGSEVFGQCVVTIEKIAYVTTMTTTISGNYVYLYLSGSGEATIDWGDGSEPLEVTLPEYGVAAPQEFRKRFTGGDPHDIVIDGQVMSLACENAYITTIDVSRNTVLRELNLNNNDLKTVDVSKNTALTKLSVAQNILSELELSGNTELKELYFYYNYLTDIDLSQNTALTHLNCDSNPLKTLDVSGNPALTVLSCGLTTTLTSLDVTHNTALTELSFGGTEIASIDLSNNPELIMLICNITPIKELNLSRNPKLETLRCFNTSQLTSLDLSGNPALANLTCNNSKITTLDLSRNTALRSLECDDNPMTELNVSANTALTVLTCRRNPLTGLDVTNNTELTTLALDETGLTNVDVTNNGKLTSLHCRKNGYTEEQMNALFGMLHENPGRKTIYIAGNWDAAYANYDIAINKGWTVNDIR